MLTPHVFGNFWRGTLSAPPVRDYRVALFFNTRVTDMSTDRLTAARATLAGHAKRLTRHLIVRSPDERIKPDHTYSDMAERTLIASGEELVAAATEAAAAKAEAAIEKGA